MQKVVLNWLRKHYNRPKVGVSLQHQVRGFPTHVYAHIVYDGRGVGINLYENHMKIFHSPDDVEYSYANPDLFERVKALINKRLVLSKGIR